MPPFIASVIAGRRMESFKNTGQGAMDENIYFSNFTLSPSHYYFLYIGELKAHGLTDYLTSALSRHSQKQVSCLSIVPDILSNYNYKNIIALSPLLAHNRKQHGRRISFRTPLKRFAQTVSHHPAVLDIIERILTQQSELFLFMFESLPEMTLDRLPNVFLLGPEKTLARKLNNKAFQFELLQDKIPVVDFRICASLAELMDISASLYRTWSDGIFISRPYSAAGAASAITRCRQDIKEKFGDRDSAFLLSRYMVHDHDPTVLAVVASPNDVYIAGVADQCIEGGNRFVGSTWPSRLPRKKLEELYQYTREVGRVIGKLGYRGIFGCDYIVDRDEQVKFIEINARKQGTTLEFCHSLAQILPVGSPSLPELEYCAVTENRFPETAVEPAPDCRPKFCWGTYNYKTAGQVQTRQQLAQDRHEQELFARAAAGEIEKGYVLLEHVGENQTVLPGTFLARTVAVACDTQLVASTLARAKEQIQATIIPDLNRSIQA